MLRIEGATKRFGALAAVNEVSFEVRAGEVLGLIGPNGAGKTTLLNLDHRHGQADARARCAFLGDDVAALAPRHIARQGHGADVPARQTAPEHDADRQRGARRLSAHARRGFSPARFGSTAPRSAAARAEALHQLRRVGLGDKFGELAGNLPLGQQRLLEVARALAADPVLVILDEPAAGLRRLEKRPCPICCAGLRGDGMTIVLVEHDMDFVMNLVDRIVVMDFGAKLAEGWPARGERRSARARGLSLGPKRA